LIKLFELLKLLVSFLGFFLHLFDSPRCILFASLLFLFLLLSQQRHLLLERAPALGLNRLQIPLLSLVVVLLEGLQFFDIVAGALGLLSVEAPVLGVKGGDHLVEVRHGGRRRLLFPGLAGTVAG
jgi:hypothetical protein